MNQFMKVVSIMLLVLAVLVIGSTSYAADAKSDVAAPDRTVLPIQEPKRPLYKELDSRNAKMQPNLDSLANWAFASVT